MDQNSRKDRRPVLFQKIHNRWYVFAEGQNGAVFTQLPEGMEPNDQSWEFYEIIENELNSQKSGEAPTKKRRPENSVPS